MNRVLLSQLLISLHVGDGPGAYFLADEFWRVLYVGRSTNLRDRLLEHLPGRESNPVIRNLQPSRAWYLNLASEQDAYAWEALGYDYYNPPGNSIRPAVPPEPKPSLLAAMLGASDGGTFEGSFGQHF